MFKKTALSSAVIAALAPAITTDALAQEDVIEEVVVKGFRGSLQRAMDIKRESGGVVDSISAEDIGKFPDTNLAESLQRITGVSIDRAGGEGKQITVRGFGPSFNTVLLNGRRVAAEEGTRGFNFDVLASELVSGLNVYKTAMATQPSGGIGSTLDVKTARPLDLGGFRVAGSVKLLLDDLSDENTPQYSGLISNTFADDRFGVLFAVSHQERESRINESKNQAWLPNLNIGSDTGATLVTESGQPYSGNTFMPQQFDLRVLTEDRTRTNANLVLQFAPSDRVTLTADAMYADFEVDSSFTSYGHWFSANQIKGIDDSDPVVDGNGTLIDFFQDTGYQTEFHSGTRDRLSDSMSVGLNVDWAVSDTLNMNFDLWSSSADREFTNGRANQFGNIGYNNRIRFQSVDTVLPLVSEFDQPGGPYDVGGLLTLGQVHPHVLLAEDNVVDNSVDQFKLDVEWFGDGGLSARAGVAFSEESRDLKFWSNFPATFLKFLGFPEFVRITDIVPGFQQITYTDENGDPLPLILPQDLQSVFDPGGDFLSGVSGIGNLPTVWLQHDVDVLAAFLEGVAASVGAPFSYRPDLLDRSYEVTEETLAWYFEVDFEGEIADMPLFVTAGFREERTDVSVDGIGSRITELVVVDEDGMVANTTGRTEVSEEADYKFLLPNFSARLDITDTLVARLAASRTMTRPTLSQMTPVVNINSTGQGGRLTSSGGNPGLRPFLSDNLDLSLEWYYGDASYVSVAYFTKEVDNFIVTGQVDKTFELPGGGLLTDPSTGSDPMGPDAGDTVAVFKHTTPSNGEEATVDGFEIAIQHNFWESGFGVLANATFVESNAEPDFARVDQQFALTGLSDSMNLVGFYEKGPWQARLSWNWRDGFVQSLTTPGSSEPQLVEEYEQMDFSASYDWTDNLTVFVEGINLTNEWIHKRGRFDNHFLLAEQTGRRFAVGVRGTFE